MLVKCIFKDTIFLVRTVCVARWWQPQWIRFNGYIRSL